MQWFNGAKRRVSGFGGAGLRCCGRVVGSTPSASSDNQEPPPKKGPPQQRPRKENGAGSPGAVKRVGCIATPGTGTDPESRDNNGPDTGRPVTGNGGVEAIKLGVLDIQ